MKQYLDILQEIVDEGYAHEDRTGVGRISIIGKQLRFDLSLGFPLVTTRKVFTKALIEEMLWFIRGSTDNKELNDKGVKIWDHWALKEEHLQNFKEKFEGNTTVDVEELVEEGASLVDTIGPMYGYVWRNSLTGVDQLQLLIDNLKKRPYSSRHVVTAWIPELVPNEDFSPQENIIMGAGSLAPCHAMFQCFVKKPVDGKKPKLSLLMYQR